jgi:hypothetical protein
MYSGDAKPYAGGELSVNWRFHGCDLSWFCFEMVSQVDQTFCQLASVQVL